MSQELKKTPLNALHRELGARMVEFGGWDMPVQYSSVLEEHHAVRKAVGLFDVSHMGQMEVSGGGALALLQRLTPNDASKLRPGTAQYSALLTPEGTFVDDTLVYQLHEREYLLVPNASNIEKDTEWVKSHAANYATVTDRSEEYGLLALQGPAAAQVLARVVDEDLTSLKSFHFRRGHIATFDAIISRTGYTGEDGFELFVPAANACDIFSLLLDAGSADGIKPCGLAARDTLRLEAKLALYGNDIDETTTPLEAGLNFIVKLNKGPFMGSDVLAKQKAEGLKRKLSGFVMRDKGIGRHGYPVYAGGVEVGKVTSGCPSPTLAQNIGLVYLPIEHAAPGRPIEIEVRGKRLAAEVVETPFYRR